MSRPPCVQQNVATKSVHIKVVMSCYKNVYCYIMLDGRPMTVTDFLFSRIPRVCGPPEPCRPIAMETNGTPHNAGKSGCGEPTALANHITLHRLGAPGHPQYKAKTENPTSWKPLFNSLWVALKCTHINLANISLENLMAWNMFNKSLII